MNATERLDAIEARASAATEGPWVRGVRLVHSPNYVAGPEFRDSDGELDRLILADRIDNAGDATFIASARTDVPALVAALRAVLHLADVADRGLPAVLPDDIRSTITAALEVTR